MCFTTFGARSTELDWNLLKLVIAIFKLCLCVKTTAGANTCSPEMGLECPQQLNMSVKYVTLATSMSWVQFPLASYACIKMSCKSLGQRYLHIALYQLFLLGSQGQGKLPVVLLMKYLYIPQNSAAQTPTQLQTETPHNYMGDWTLYTH